jgi:O-antigen ligase
MRSDPPPVPARLAFYGLCAFCVLLPFGRLSELGALLCLLACACHVRAPKIALRPVRAALLAWLAVLLAALVSSIDSVNVRESVLCAVGQLRFGALIVAAGLLSTVQRRQVAQVAALCVALWTLDALLQAATGISLGGASYADRISGVFGKDNLKLGLIVAVLSPILLHAARFGAKSAVATWLALAAVVLLAGARAGWVMFALVSVLCALKLYANLQARHGVGALHHSAGARRHGAGARRQAVLGLLAASALALGLAALLNATNDKLAQRVQRTMALLDGKTADFALAGRLPIWRTARRMAQAHPLNGVGVRGFRYAYPTFAAPNDPWVQTPACVGTGPCAAQGATHPHQLVLEIVTETGVIGLLLWLCAAYWLLRAWQRAGPIARANAWPWGVALLALVFPINTHTAMYSAFWGGVLWWLVALFSASLAASDATDANTPVAT